MSILYQNIIICIFSEEINSSFKRDSNKNDFSMELSNSFDGDV